MKNDIPTIEELLGLPKGELHAMCRNATSLASDQRPTSAERESAAKTIDNTLRVQPRFPTRRHGRLATNSPQAQKDSNRQWRISAVLVVAEFVAKTAPKGRLYPYLSGKSLILNGRDDKI
jgi:hypothetical protein